MTADAEKLESWKQIAGYLARDVKTVQRWERHEGLPIHRLLHTGHGSVFAWKQELDSWYDSRQKDPAPIPSHHRPFPRDRIWCALVSLALATTLAVHILRSP